MDLYEIRNKIKFERLNIYDLPLKVCFYARVSTSSDAQLNSIENQITYYKEYIKNNKNWAYIDGYIDEGISGISTKNREQFNQMIRDAKLGKFDLIITKEISRFARSTLDSIKYTQELLKSGVCVYFQNDNLNTIDPDNELRLSIMSSIAQEEVRKLSERIKFGHQRSIEKGVVLGNSQIYGFDKKNGKLVINEIEAKLVKKIYELFIDGNSLKQISKILENEGYRNRNSKPIAHNTIGNIIKNPKYKEFYVGNKVKITDYRTKIQKFLPEEEWRIYKDIEGTTVPSIISEEIWEEANRIFLQKSDIVKSKRSSFKQNSIYTGKIFCEEHNTPYWRSSYRNKEKELVYHWICSHKKTKGTSTCNSFVIYEDEINHIVENVILSIADNFDDYFDELIEFYKTIDMGSDEEKVSDKIQEEIAHIKKKKDRLLELNLDGSISNDEFKLRNDSFNVEMSKLYKNISELESNSDIRLKMIKGIYELKAYIKKNTTDLGNNNVVDDELIKRLLFKINVTPVSENKMRINILLNTGHTSNLPFSKLDRCSGSIIKKMIQQYENNMK